MALFKDPFAVGTKIIVSSQEGAANDGWDSVDMPDGTRVFTKVKSVRYMKEPLALDAVVAKVEARWGDAAKIVYPAGKSGPPRPDPDSWVSYVRRR